MYGTYLVTHSDGYQHIVIGDIEEVLMAIDRNIPKHGESTKCERQVSYNRYTGSKYERIW